MLLLLLLLQPITATCLLPLSFVVQKSYKGLTVPKSRYVQGCGPSRGSREDSTSFFVLDSIAHLHSLAHHHFLPS